VVNDEGRVVYAIESTEVKLKFEAPKTQVMGIIINGLLDRKLHWGLVLIGAFLAVALELCGVSSLAFAVGVYIPMQYSTPIFLGGLIRWAVDAYVAHQARSAAAAANPEDAEARAAAEVEAITRSETSPGVLLSSGLIAGGSLAGVMIAFLELPFFQLIKEKIDYGQAVPGADPEPLARWMWTIPQTNAALDIPPMVVFLLLMVFLGLVGAALVFPPKKQN
jgi:hypothetical protein